MNRLLTASALALGCLLAVSNQRVFAQFGPYQPYGRTGTSGYNPARYGPLLSPYLNLRPNAASNYFLGTIPEEQRRAQYRQLSTEIQGLEQRGAAPAPLTEEDLIPRLPETGHGVTFMNMSPYYTFGPSGSGTALGGQAGQRPTTAPSRRGR
jgi:hypothetical protein